MAPHRSSNHPAIQHQAAQRQAVQHQAAQHQTAQYQADGRSVTGRSADTVCPRRLASLSAAVELGVDADDVSLESAAERRLWEELQEEFHAFVAKIGPVWIADGPVAP